MECYAKNYCKQYGQKCHSLCDLMLKLNVIYDLSCIPKRYRYDQVLTPVGGDLPAFKQLDGWKNTVLDKVHEGENLYIYSHTCGNGKTSWAFKIANYYIRKVVASSNLDNEVVYVNCPQFLEQLRSNYNTPQEGFAQLKDRLLTCNLLILDDIGSEKPSEWVSERLYDIINTRYSEMKTIIYTSNYTPKELSVRLGDRIGSRVTGSTVVELKGLDRRGAKC